MILDLQQKLASRTGSTVDLASELSTHRPLPASGSGRATVPYTRVGERSNNRGETASDPQSDAVAAPAPFNLTRALSSTPNFRSISTADASECKSCPIAPVPPKLSIHPKSVNTTPGDGEDDLIALEALQLDGVEPIVPTPSKSPALSARSSCDTCLPDELHIADH